MKTLQPINFIEQHNDTANSVCNSNYLSTRPDYMLFCDSNLVGISQIGKPEIQKFFCKE